MPSKALFLTLNKMSKWELTHLSNILIIFIVAIVVLMISAGFRFYYLASVVKGWAFKGEGGYLSQNTNVNVNQTMYIALKAKPQTKDGVVFYYDSGESVTVVFLQNGDYFRYGPNPNLQSQDGSILSGIVPLAYQKLSNGWDDITLTILNAHIGSSRISIGGWPPNVSSISNVPIPAENFVGCISDFRVNNFLVVLKDKDLDNCR